MMLLHDLLRQKNAFGGLVRPVVEQSYQPASIDLRLGSTLLMYDKFDPRDDRTSFRPQRFDIRQKLEDRPQPTVTTITEKDPWILRPGEWLLAATLEGVSVPYDMVGRIEGKSGWARVGLSIHNAGFVDPGWGMQHYEDGPEVADPWPLTLELKNLGDLEIVLYPGMWIAQMSYLMGAGGSWATGYGATPFKNHYWDSRGVVASLIEQDMTLGHVVMDEVGRPWRKLPDSSTSPLLPLIPSSIAQEIMDQTVRNSPIHDAVRTRGVKPDKLSWEEVPIPEYGRIDYAQVQLVDASSLSPESDDSSLAPTDES